jgi:hypothetical protein
MRLFDRWIAAVVVIALLVIGACAGYEELRYALRGRHTEGVITNVEIVRKRKGYNDVVYYKYTEADGTQRTGNMVAQPDGKEFLGRRVTVVYVPGGSSRLVGFTDRVGVVFFVIVVCGALVIAIVWVINAIRSHIPSRRRRKKRRRYE